MGGRSVQSAPFCPIGAVLSTAERPAGNAARHPRVDIASPFNNGRWEGFIAP